MNIYINRGYASLIASIVFVSSGACVPNAPEILDSTEEAIRASPEWTYKGRAKIRPLSDEQSIELSKINENAENAVNRLLSEKEASKDKPLAFVSVSGRIYERVGDSVPKPGFTKTAPFHFYGEGAAAPGERGEDVNKKIWGADQRVLWGSTTSYPARAHVALRNSKSTTKSFCSGVYIGPRHVLTAAHCFYYEGAFTRTFSKVRVVPGQDGSGNSSWSTPYGKRRIVGHFIPPEWISTEDWKYDYAILVLRDSFSAPGWLGMKVLSKSSLKGLNVNINGYPGHSNDCADSPIIFGSDEGNCGGYLYHGYGAIKNVYSRTFRHKIDTQSGQSGSPVYRYLDGKRHLVGVHSGYGDGTNRATRLTTSVFNNVCDCIRRTPSAYYDHDCY